jgi:SET domain-containing protein
MYNLIEIKKSNIHGKGVFAKTFIPKNTQLYCDIIEIEKNILNKYQYPWNGNIKCVCVGFGSFFNSSNKPNVKINKIDKINLIKYFITLKNIQKGEELTLNYKI